jgi:hypothetical protein
LLHRPIAGQAAFRIEIQKNFSKYNLQTGCGSVTTMFDIKIR